MTILVDARPLVDPAAGGVTRVAAGLLPALVRAMPDTKFLFATTGLHRPALPLTKGEVEGVHLPLPNKLWSLISFLGLASFDQLATKHKPDILLLPNLGFVGRPRIPYAIIVHDISFLIEPRWFSRKARWWHNAVRAKRLIKDARWIFAVSERTKQDLIERLDIDPEKIRVIPIGLDAGTGGVTPPLPPTLENKRFVLALGAKDPRKNASCAIAAVETLQKDPRFTDVVLVLVGAPLAGARSDGTSLRDGAGTRPAPTIFFGRPSDDALAALMRHASAFLYPSWYEGFGLPLHEAARFGTPCIASTAGALPETAPNGTLFASPAKPHHWVIALETILHHPEHHRTSTSLGDWTEAAEIVKQTVEKHI